MQTALRPFSTTARRPLVAMVATVAAVLVVLGVAAALRSSAGTATDAPLPVAAVQSVGGAPAPRLDLAPLAGATRVTLPSRVPVVVVFFASWCPGCQEEMSTVHRLAASAGGGVRFVGVDVSDDPAAAAAVVRRFHLQFPVGIDAEHTTASAYRLAGLPSTVFVDASGLVVGRSTGPLSLPSGQAWVSRLAGTAR